jgi:hypothetical protein
VSVLRFGSQRIAMRKMRDLLVALEQLRARRAHVLARFVEPEGGVPDLLLQQIEACSHLPQLVAGVGLHGHDVDGGVRGLQIAAPEGLHCEREIAQRSPCQPFRGRAHLLRRVR